MWTGDDGTARLGADPRRPGRPADRSRSVPAQLL